MFGVIDYPTKLQKKLQKKSQNVSSKNLAGQGNFHQKAVSLHRFVGARFRSSRGCWGCRKRRKKCDETHPICNACAKRNQQCVWRDENKNEPAQMIQKQGENRREIDSKLQKNRRSSGLALNELLSPEDPESSNSPKTTSLEYPTPHETESTNQLEEFENFDRNFDESDLVEISASQPSALELSPNSIQLVSREPSESLSPFSQALFGEDIYMPPLQSAFFSLFLDSKGVSFVRHFENEVSGALTVSPSTSNYFSKTFLSLATMDESIGHAIASWGAFYVHQYDHIDVQKHFFQAMSLTAKKFPKGSEISKYDYFTLLCFHLIVTGFFVCQGDISQWWICFAKCTELVKRSGGLKKLCIDLDHSNDIKFLVSNFFYHDIMSSHAFSHGTTIPVKEYKQVFEPGFFDPSYGIDPLQGCMNPVYLLLAEELEVRAAMRTRRLRLESLLNGELGAEDDPNILGEFESMRTSYLEYCELVAQQIEEKIQGCIIDETLLAACTEAEVKMHCQIFTVFKLVCKLYWVLYIKELPPKANESQLLLVQLMAKIDKLVESKMIVVLCLPLVIACSACYTKHDRRRMEIIFSKVIGKCPIHNVHRAWVVVQEIWKRNPKGELTIDWADICEDLNWQLCVC
ncbi:hypothetical protein PGUG_04553 [Meyerozyma guilliermondii ATCC 6260]|uniref:Zn(2)-C6 fungal-type domain-containing protein n=1 Tax=Meyerozyma guilliermondii (strain ATCC 6260 / CBS 566 / DSM 6381 / JCM 1539 / NBRC 10279 / NRRL Y-324) TaxID=294746 RepID=A5DMQ2_PICGU|nr:uncharacterized protein PGUG_04553 [Meyerozyma guilliermondii ATCC 6260]EDK40455.2 hypothetical protein PGUG_04553 [Meyerozyma guilliermondii ATCC 6260]